MKIININKSNIDYKIINNLLINSDCLVSIFSKSCIHCKIMKPEWNMFKKKLKNINSNLILFDIDYNYLNNIDNSILKNIAGLPSILIFKNNNIFKEYNGDRTCNDLLKFITPYIKSTKLKTKKKLFCKNKKNGKNGCRICCSKYKKRKTYKKCINICMKS